MTDELRELRAGPLTAALDGVDLRYVRLGGLELVRRIYVAVRDHNWRTIPGAVAGLELDARGESFDLRFSVRHTSPDVDFAWRGHVAGDADGRIVYAMDGAASRDMRYNRIGLCVLHPFRESAGARFRARGPAGEVTGELPRDVGPQRFENGVYVPLFPSCEELELELPGGGAVRFAFSGDLFETEDQRNWTDASFKTYCTPLALGFPHSIAAGERLAQSVTVSLAGAPAAPERPARPVRIELGEPLGRTLPALGLARASDGAPLGEEEVTLLRRLGLDHLRVDVHLERRDWQAEIASGLDEARRLGWRVELALFLRPEHEPELARLAELVADAPLARVLPVWAGGASATREETTPPELRRLVRERLAGVPVFAGTDMNFCELNRTRPESGAGDGVFYPIVPTVHAVDDVSLVETLEAQAETVRTAKAIAAGGAVAVGPISFRYRYNPVATGPEAAPAADELPPDVDARQPSLLGAAWTLGSLAYLAEAGAAAATYFEAAGWRGVVERPGGSPLPRLFPSQPGAPFPLAHVLAWAGAARGEELRACRSSDPLAVVGLAAGRRLALANLTPRPQRIAGLAGRATGARLATATGPGALPRAELDLADLELAPHETVFLDLP